MLPLAEKPETDNEYAEEEEEKERRNACFFLRIENCGNKASEEEEEASMIGGRPIKLREKVFYISFHFQTHIMWELEGRVPVKLCKCVFVKKKEEGESRASKRFFEKI